MTVFGMRVPLKLPVRTLPPPAEKSSVFGAPTFSAIAPCATIEPGLPAPPPCASLMPVQGTGAQPPVTRYFGPSDTICAVYRGIGLRETSRPSASSATRNNVPALGPDNSKKTPLVWLPCCELRIMTPGSHLSHSNVSSTPVSPYTLSRTSQPPPVVTVPTRSPFSAFHWAGPTVFQPLRLVPSKTFGDSTRTTGVAGAEVVGAGGGAGEHPADNTPATTLETSAVQAPTDR